jgi:hypothetical protein
MLSLTEIPEIERKIIRIGKYERINSVTKNDTLTHTLKDMQEEISKKPLTSRLPIIMRPTSPNIVWDGIAGVIKTISKEWAYFDYLEVPHEIASSELIWKGTVRPELNNFYIISPRNNKVYFPFEKYHSLAFEEKVNEAIRIMMHLKPRELLVVHEEGYGHGINTSTEVEAKAKMFEGKGEVQLEKKTGKEVKFKASFQESKQLDWEKSIQLPDDLIWYPTEEKWRSIVEGVLTHGLKQVDMEINYIEDFGVNAKLQADIMKQANIKVKSDVTQFQKTSWNVIASFW